MTATEWLKNEIHRMQYKSEGDWQAGYQFALYEVLNLIEQAKQMEKEQAELRYKDGTPMRKYNSPKLQAIEVEISDEEIENEADRYEKVDGINSFKEAIKWYREQLNNKND